MTEVMVSGLTSDGFYEEAFDETYVEYTTLQDACEALLTALAAGSTQVMGEDSAYDFVAAIEDALGKWPAHKVEDLSHCEPWMVAIRDAMREVIKLSEFGAIPPS